VPVERFFGFSAYEDDLQRASQRRYYTKEDILAQAEFGSQIFGVVASLEF
jgi:hypothetical protein